jgi:hypothetical protein
MKWFGKSWGAPINEHCGFVPTPVGEICILCDKPILEGDSGFILPHFDYPERFLERANHRRCFLETVFGREGAEVLMAREWVPEL